MVSDTTEPQEETVPEPGDDTEESELFRFTKDNAAEYGKKGGQASGRARGNKPTLEDLLKQGPAVLKELLDAATGRGNWSKLDPKDRLSALKAALPYVLGRPSQQKPAEEPEDEEDATDFNIAEANPSNQEPN